MNDEDKQYIESLFDDEIQKKIIEIMADDSLTPDQIIEKIVAWMAAEGIE